MITIQKVKDTHYYLINGFVYLLPLRFRAKGITSVLTAYVAQKMQLQLVDLKPNVALTEPMTFSYPEVKSIVKTNKGLI